MYVLKKTKNIYVVDGLPVDRRDAKKRIPGGASTCAVRDVLVMYFMSRNPGMTYETINRLVVGWVKKNIQIVRAIEFDELWFPVLKRRHDGNISF